MRRVKQSRRRAKPACRLFRGEDVQAVLAAQSDYGDVEHLRHA
jgi:hypothetical protein